jgi:heme-degrading monooxygenase HmoA
MMFLLNEILIFTPGRRHEALDRLAWIHGLMAADPGFQRAIVAKYLGEGLRHAVLRVWDDEQSYQRFREGPEGNYGRGRPEGLYSNEKVIPQWQSVVETVGTGNGRHLVKIQYDVPADRWEDWIEHQKRLHGIRHSLGGLAGAWTFRSKKGHEDGDESLSIARFEGRHTQERLLDSADFVKTLLDNPDGVKLQSIENFEIVSETLPAS